MYCVECGSALADNMKFCPYCGFKVALPAKVEQSEEVKNKNKEKVQRTVRENDTEITLPICKNAIAVNFQILNRNVTLEPNRVLYNFLRLRFQDYADSALDQFSRDYNSYNSLKDIIQQSPKHAFKAIQPALKECINELIANGIYTVDEETFYGKYVLPLERWQDSYQYVADQYAEIVLEKERHAEYRRACKENRGRWVGGGFGVSGAIKGSVTAGAMNVFTGASYSIMNGIGNMFSAVKASGQMDRIFNNPNTRSSLEKGVWDTVFAMHQGLIACICEKTGNTQLLNGSITNKAADMAFSILKNIPQISNKVQREDALIEAFNLNPYQDAWFEYVFDYYSDRDGKLDKLADYLGISVVDRLKETALAEMFQHMSLETEEQALEARNIIWKTKKQLHHNKSSKTLCAIETALKEFDIKARTVDGILFDTRKEADSNTKEFAAFSSKLEAIQSNDLDALKELYTELQQHTGKVAVKYKQIVSEKIEKLDLSRRTVKVTIGSGQTIVFSTEKEAEAAQEYVDTLQKLVDKAPADSHDKAAYYYAIVSAMEKDPRTEAIPEISSIYAAVIKHLVEREVEVVRASDNLIYKYYDKLQTASQERIFIGDKLTKATKIISKARKSYLEGLGYTNDEKVLLIYDNTVLKSGEKGFTITKRGFYSTGGTFGGKFFIPLKDIKPYDVNIRSSDLEVNGKITDIVQTSWLTRDIVADLVKAVIRSNREFDVKKYAITIPPSKNDPSTKILTAELRKKGQYQEIFKMAVDEESAEKELLASIMAGKIYNYHEIGLYIHEYLSSIPAKEIKNFYFGQIKHIKQDYNHKDNAVNGYLLAENFSNEEYVIFLFSEANAFSYGFTLTSRGVYVNTQNTAKHKFYTYDTLIIEINDSNSMLIIGDSQLDISMLCTDSRKRLLTLLQFITSTIPIVNSYRLEQLSEMFSCGELTSDEYQRKKLAIESVKPENSDETRDNNRAGANSSHTSKLPNYHTKAKFLLKLNNGTQKSTVINSPQPLFQIIDLLQEKNIVFMEFILEGEDGSVLRISYENTVLSLSFMQKGITRYTVLGNQIYWKIMKRLVLDFFKKNYSFDYVDWF